MNLRKVRECIGLLNSMIKCGEQHSEQSEKLMREALAELDRLEIPKPSSEISFDGSAPFEGDL